MQPLIDTDVPPYEPEPVDWVPIYEDYILYPDGRVFSYAGRNPRWLKGYIGKNGYLYYTFKDGTREYAHRLVAKLFCYCPVSTDTLQVNHKDMNRLNNHYLNLEWVTPAENNLHAHKKPSRNKIKSFNHSNCKLTKEQAIEIYLGDGTQEATAKLYGVSPKVVFNIRRGRSYYWATKEVIDATFDRQ